MVNSKSVDNNKPKEKTYPYLGSAKVINDYNNNVIVLFTKHDTGMIVHAEKNSILEVGFYTDNWFEEDFIPTDRIVELYN